MTLEDPSLSAHGYQFLPLATSHFVGNNREFQCFRHILRCFIHCSWRGLITIEDP